jgi:hypothetical protein
VPFRLGVQRRDRYAVAMMSKVTRMLLLIVIAGVLISGPRKTFSNYSQNIALKPLLLDNNRPQIRRVGQLEFMAAWELGSGNQNFGGISALTALTDGRFVGTSDAGTLIGFGLANDDRIDRPFIAPLPNAFDKGLGYADRDSESIAYDPASGRFWVGYEGKAAIRRFSPGFARTEAVAYPIAMQKWGANSGAEAIIRLNDGRFAAFSEGFDRPDGSYEALLFAGDPAEHGTRFFRFGYAPPKGYQITDATLLPDGRVLTLNRRVAIPEGFTAIISILDPSQIIAGATVTGTPIAVLAPPLLVDNMEGITTTQERGRTIVWMISDNNFNIFQRTLLMKFALLPDKKKPEAKPAPGFESL